MKIAVLLACHNRKDKTISCLNSLFNANLFLNYSLEVYLVDDCSTDGTSEAVTNFFPNVNIIRGNGNLYWNQGMRLAWKTSVKKKHPRFFHMVKMMTRILMTMLYYIFFNAIMSIFL